MVIEEDGIIRRRYVEDIYKDVSKSGDTSEYDPRESKLAAMVMKAKKM